MTQGLSSVCNCSASLKNYLSAEHKEPYIFIAVGIILAIGSLVAAGCLHAQVGNYAFAIAGSGVGIGAIFILIAGLRKEKPIQPPQKENSPINRQIIPDVVSPTNMSAPRKIESPPPSEESAISTVPKAAEPVIEVASTTVVFAPEKVEVVVQPVQYDRSAMLFFKFTGKRLIGHSSIPESWEEDLKEQGIQPIDGNQLVATGGDDDPLPDLPFFHFFSYSERVPLERLVPESEEYFDMTNRRCVWILLKKVYQGETTGIIENSTSAFYEKRHGWERVQSGFGDVRKLLWWCYYHETGRLIDPARYAQQLRDVAEQYYKTDIV